MLKTILMIVLLLVLIGSVLFILTGKMFVSDLNSKDNDKRIDAQEKLKKYNLIGYIVFFCTMVLFVIVIRIF